MSNKLTSNEKKLVEHAKKAIVRYNKIRHRKGGIDTLYSFILSDSGKIYDGACYEASQPQVTICGERHAVANMIMNESYSAKIKSIVVANPVPEIQERSTFPCGSCRHEIWAHGKSDTSVVLMQYIQGKKGWTFPKMEKYSTKSLYPYAYESANPSIWDNFEPK